MPTSFDALDLSPPLLAAIAGLGYVEPTPVQSACIPALLAGRDVIGRSKTGSGKTAAFALPILQRIELERREIQALVVCPTRELSSQVAREFRALGRGLPGLAVLELIGGQPVRPQREALARGAHVAVGTPGRVLDHLHRESLDPGQVATLVLDEADRMLHMGFAEEVDGIVRDLPEERQTALFSATFPESIVTLSERYQRDAMRITIDDPEGAAIEIRELQVVVEPEGRLHALAWILNEFPHESALVFCNFKATVAELTQTLVQAGISADRLDGDLDQFHREQVLARFRNQSVRILVATDVAGRGIDIDGLDLVVNFEVPQQADTYVHRIGRTGRAGKSGVAVSLTTVGRDGRMRAIQELTGNPVETLTGNEDDQRGTGALLRALAQRPKMETILISGGRKDKVRRGDILGALTGEAGGLSGTDVGKIEVQARLSYVAVAAGVARMAVQRLNSGRIKGKRYRATLVGGQSRPPRGRDRSW